MQEEKRNDNYPDCKKTCRMCLHFKGPEKEEKLVCPWLPCYYKFKEPYHFSKKNPNSVEKP